jgi:hypothetical protein
MRHVAVLLAGALAFAACKNVPMVGGGNQAALTEAKLKSRLGEFTDNFSIIVQAASNKAVRSTQDRELRRQAVGWKAHSIPLVRKIVRERPPMDALLDVWVYSYQMVHYMQKIPVQDETLRPSLIAAGEEVLANADRIGRDIFDDDKFDEVRTAVEAFAREHPMSDTMARGSQLPSEVAGGETAAVAIVRAVPIVGAFEGLGETPKAIGEFTQMAGQLGNIVSTMPEEIRWQMELALYDIESRETTDVLREGIESVTDSTRTLTEVVATVPDDVQNLLDETFENLEASREGVHETLLESQAALAQGVEIAGSAERTAASVALAAASLEALSLNLVELTAPDPDAEPEPAPDPDTEPAPPFDINDYGDTADDLREAVEEVRGLLGDVKTMVDDKAYEAPIDHMFLRVVQAVAAVLIAFFLYRVAMAWLAKNASD